MRLLCFAARNDLSMAEKRDKRHTADDVAYQSGKKELHHVMCPAFIVAHYQIHDFCGARDHVIDRIAKCRSGWALPPGKTG